ncbi:hypothetical protein [Sphingomonas rhizophila]|uniref:hypothetical protein n=1 Tax=Sphingomonas rhizophila TaxID=2071607 RepID=UPI001FE3A373|nr:hypothetical protein [Sphingomonas rhizophila]
MGKLELRRESAREIGHPDQHRREDRRDERQFDDRRAAIVAKEVAEPAHYATSRT